MTSGSPREALLDDAALFAVWKTGGSGAPAEMRGALATALMSSRVPIHLQVWIEWCMRHPDGAWRLQADYLRRSWRDEPRGFPPVFAR